MFSSNLAAAAALFVSIAALASVASSACARDASDDGGAIAEAGATVPGVVKPAPQRASPPVLAEATNPDASVIVQVVDVRRASADTVYVAFAATNTSSGEKAVPVKPLGDAKPADFCLITADGMRRLFLLRNAQNEPVLDGDPDQPLKPGERRLFHALFPAPPPAAAPAPPVRVTVMLGPYVLRNVPIPAQAQPTATP